MYDSSDLTMSDSEANQSNCTPPELVAVAQDVVAELLPKKSSQRYLTAYKNFMDWRNTYQASSFSQNVIMAYIS